MPLDNSRYNNYITGMTAKLKDEIKQVKPFASREQEAFLNLQRTADAMMRGLEEGLRPSGLTQTQYNVLRILRGAGENGLLCRQVAERMVTCDPDMTRLLDRLESRGLVTRLRDRRDRRAITVRITREGIRLVSSLDEPIAALHRRQLAHLGDDRIRRLIGLLEDARQALD
jgi:DNA-binding MarR family transcriptional regulator